MLLNDLKEKISEIIMNSRLPVDAIYFVIKDIFKEVEQLYYLELQKETEKAQQKENKKESEK